MFMGLFVIVGAAEREGNVVARVISRADAATLNAFVRHAVSDKVSFIHRSLLRRNKNRRKRTRSQ
jgi:hypothetical protein